MSKVTFDSKAKTYTIIRDDGSQVTITTDDWFAIIQHQYWIDQIEEARYRTQDIEPPLTDDALMEIAEIYENIYESDRSESEIWNDAINIFLEEK